MLFSALLIISACAGTKQTSCPTFDTKSMRKQNAKIQSKAFGTPKNGWSKKKNKRKVDKHRKKKKKGKSDKNYQPDPILANN